jgi:hypothetical protein
MEFQDILTGHGLRSRKEEDQGAGIEDSFIRKRCMWVDQLAKGSKTRTRERPPRTQASIYLCIKY